MVVKHIEVKPIPHLSTLYCWLYNSFISWAVGPDTSCCTLVVQAGQMLGPFTAHDLGHLLPAASAGNMTGSRDYGLAWPAGVTTGITAGHVGFAGWQAPLAVASGCVTVPGSGTGR